MRLLLINTKLFSDFDKAEKTQKEANKIIYAKEKKKMYNNALFIILIIWVIVLLVFYHKFLVHHFSMGQGLLKELVGAVILGAIMTGLTLKFWWLTAIIIVLFGIVMAKKKSNSMILVVCVFLAVIITTLGIKFNAGMKKEEVQENETNESSESEEWETTSSKNDEKNNLIDSDYLDYLLNGESQQPIEEMTMPESFTEETAEEVYSDFIHIDDIKDEDISTLEYILKDSSSRYLTKEDLQNLNADECRIARNEIYARHGRKFDDEVLQDYFNACSWYHGTIEPNDFQETMLSDIEVANKNLIVEYEKEMGYR